MFLFYPENDGQKSKYLFWPSISGYRKKTQKMNFEVESEILASQTEEEYVLINGFLQLPNAISQLKPLLNEIF